MLTGLIPPRHGVRDNVRYRLADSVVTLAELLREQGYQTGAFIGALPLSRTGGLAQGFDVYDDEIAPRALGDMNLIVRPERFAEEVFASAQEWLQATDDRRPVFAFVHVYDPHAPYEKPMPGTDTLSYDGEIAYVDRSLGDFLSSIRTADRWREALTIVTSDHGEGLGQHGEKTHCLFVYEQTLHVPLIVHWPNVLTPRRAALPVGLVDLMPTVLEFTGLKPLPDIDGRSLVTLARGKELNEKPLYFESLFGYLGFGWAPLRGIRLQDLKYTQAPKPELYDLRTDPLEEENLITERPDDASRLASLLREVKDEVDAPMETDRQRMSALASLGYVSAPPVETDDPSELPDPKDHIEVYERFHEAHHKCAHGKVGPALEIMASLEPDLRNSPYFYLEWGNFATKDQRWPLAEECFRKSLALDELGRDARYNLAVALFKQSDWSESVGQLDELLSRNPDHADGQLLAGLIKAQHLGMPAEALSNWNQFLELAPDHVQAGKIRKAVSQLSGRLTAGGQTTTPTDD